MCLESFWCPSHQMQAFLGLHLSSSQLTPHIPTKSQGPHCFWLVHSLKKATKKGSHRQGPWSGSVPFLGDRARGVPKGGWCWYPKHMAEGPWKDKLTVRMPCLSLAALLVML